MVKVAVGRRDCGRNGVRAPAPNAGCDGESGCAGTTCSATSRRSWRPPAAAELDAEVADRTRREAAQLALVDRARAAVGHPVTLRVLGAGPVDGLLADVGAAVAAAG